MAEMCCLYIRTRHAIVVAIYMAGRGRTVGVGRRYSHTTAAQEKRPDGVRKLPMHRSWHPVKVLLKAIADRLIHRCEREENSPEEQCRFGPQRSTVDMIFVVRPSHQLTRKKGTPLYTCFVDLAKAYVFKNIWYLELRNTYSLRLL